MDVKGIYTAAANRYADADALYKRCGKSGVLLPKISLGFWHNFGGVDPYERSRAITHYAFDHGITHFDLANNYGPPYGSAEETMGRLMQDDFRPYRDELFFHAAKIRKILITSKCLGRNLLLFHFSFEKGITL